jgi:hypothetical protein
MVASFPHFQSGLTFFMNIIFIWDSHSAVEKDLCLQGCYVMLTAKFTSQHSITYQKTWIFNYVMLKEDPYLVNFGRTTKKKVFVIYFRNQRGTDELSIHVFNEA